jgi:hypothetical protein
MNRLRTDAPDLASIVLEERGMTAIEAIAALEHRIKIKSDAETEAKQKAAAEEANKRETILRLSEAAYRGVVAWSADEFVCGVQERLDDKEFRKTLIDRLRPDASKVKEIAKGAKALAGMLAGLKEE